MVFIERAPDENIEILVEDKVYYNDDPVQILINADPAFQYYSWDFGDGHQIDSIARSDDTLHIYRCDNQYLVSITAYTNTVCQNIGTGSKQVNILPPSLSMISVSNEITSNLNLQVDWEYEGSALYKQLIHLSRKQIFPEQSDWEKLGSFGINDTYYEDNSRPSDSTIYLYRVQTNQQCSNLASSLEHNNILLTSIEFEDDSSTLVSWNEYINWDGGVEKYEIWRKTDDHNYVLIGESDDPEEMYAYGYDGFDFCYRIKAVENDGKSAISWSNESCVDFVPTIKTYNFFSPNEDAFNQFLTFDRIGLYPNSVLTIYNRYGSKITEFKNYQNNWDGKISGKLVPAGTYFYALKLNEPRNLQPFIKGYFSIMY